jgi:polysaccharide deacetylase 2 family uncharacterized protein YibQ
MKDFTAKEIVIIHTALNTLQNDIREKNTLKLKTTPDDIQEIIWKILKSI